MLRARMELRHLRYFIAVAEAENVSRAALKLHVSQPALSHQIRDLEDELGFSLLERSAKSVRLTKAGRTFLAEARAVMQRVEDAVQAARAAAEDGSRELHIGYAPSLTSRLLPPALRAFQSESPKSRVKLHDLSTEEILAWLREGTLRIGVLVRPTRAMLRGLRFEELLKEPVRLAVAPAHKFARRRSVTLAEAAREPLIAYSRKEYPEYHDYLSAILGDITEKPRVAEEHDSVSSLIASVEAVCGVALVPESIGFYSGERLKLILISPTPEPFVVGAAWPENDLGEPAATFLKCAREVARTIKSES